MEKNFVLMNFHVFYVLELKTSKKIPSVYLYACLSVRPVQGKQ